MPRTLRSESRYGRRLLTATAVAVVGVVLAVIFGPKGNPEGEWYEKAHTGVRGPTLLLENIEIVQEEPDDPVVQTESHELARMTQGVDPRITEKIIQEDPLDPRPLEQRLGRPLPSPLDVPSEEDGRSRVPGQQERVSMSRPAQQSLQFVLLHAVDPTYPDQATPLQRQRRIVVVVQMYVNERGEVAEALIAQNDGGPLFAQAVLEAVRQWRYEPLVIDGETTGFWDQIRCTFTVGGGAVRSSDGIVPRAEGGG